MKRPLIQMPERTWTPTNKNFQDIRLCDGLNQGLNPLDISQGQATSILNFVPYEYPTLVVREGFTQVGSTKTGQYITHIRKYGDDLVIGTKNGVYRRSGTSWTNIIDSTLSERYWTMTKYGDNLFMADGSGKVQKYTGSATSAVSDTPDNSRYVTMHANRMFLVADDEPNVIRWSKYENPEVFNTFLGDVEDPSYQPLNNTNVGEDIEGIITYRDRVLIFKKHSFHSLNGERGYDFTINDVSTHIGCIAWRTICEVNNILYFLSSDGVFAYSGGTIPNKPISDPVKTYLKAINWSQLHQCVSGTDGRRLYLTLVTGLNTLPNVTLMYDPDRGPENGWFVHDYNSTAYLNDDENWYTGSDDGKVFTMDDGDNDAGTNISYEVISKPIVRGSWHVKTRLNKVRMVVDIPAGASMDIYYSISTNGDDWELIKSLSPDTDVKNTKIMLVGKRSEWFRIKVSGVGRVKIYSIAYEIE